MPYALIVVLMILGFGFVVFFHELGHFLAAKWSGVKVEQFAVGFGHALLSWRKGLGFRIGSSTKEYEKLQKEKPQIAASISETEYRWNWIPLGGYVKMLGQDDMKPGAEADDPRAFNRQTIGKRMVIVSAGVIMNVILAIIGFTILFRIGFNVPPPLVGSVMPDSPAQAAKIRSGDRILKINGKSMYNDFTKVPLNVALAPEGKAIPVVIEHPDKTTETVMATPRRSMEARGFLALGFTQSLQLKVPPLREPLPKNLDQMVLKEATRFQPGDTIVAVNGQPVGLKDYYIIDNVIQHSDGQPVTLTVRNSANKERTEKITPQFQRLFDDQPLSLVGMTPRTTADSVLPNSTALGKIMPGDVILAVGYKASTDQLSNPTDKEVRKCVDTAGQDNLSLIFTVLRNEKTIDVPVEKTIKVDKNRYGIGIGLGFDEQHAVVASTLENSPAAKAGIPRGAALVSINDQPVKTWYDVRKILLNVESSKPVQIVALSPKEGQKIYTLALTPEAIAGVRNINLTSVLTSNGILQELTEARQTNRPLEAAQWGVVETRDFILQFYLTIKRMCQGSVSVTNLMGPLGIFETGTKLASRGLDWLLWFLAMISANLAVVNFLPIPVVDGGLFTFLILEKIQGKPLSQRTQTIAQYIGLSLLLGIFLFVTYQDLMRMIW